MMLRIVANLHDLKIKKWTKELLKAVDEGLNDTADYIATQADSRLRNEEMGSFDTGFLARSLVVDKDEEYHKVVAYQAPYAPYIEFGTQPHFPPVKPLYDWVWRKRAILGVKPGKIIKTKKDGDVRQGIWKVAWAICRKIAKDGSEPKPYFRPAITEGKEKMNEFIKIRIKETRKQIREAKKGTKK